MGVWNSFRKVCFLLIILLSPSIRSSEIKRSPPKGFEGEALQELRKNKFVRNLTCKMFADLVLTQVGLPRLGQDVPISGVREDFDRSQDLENPPVFVDSAIRSEHPFSEYRVKAYGHSKIKDFWYLELVRNREITRGSRAELKSLFVFRIGTVANHPTCDLMEIHFEEPSKTDLGIYDSSRCLNLFDPAASSSNIGTADLSVIQQDCALGLRYFLSTKWSR
jgi:hypothetical protein